jgi:hypothetical protein
MLHTPLNDAHLYRSFVLALRDFREACGRDATTGVGDGNASWIGLSLGMIVLDTLSGSGSKVWLRWKNLLTQHDISPDDAKVIYMLRCSLVHGYGPPRPDLINDRKLLLTDDHDAFAVDTAEVGRVWLSVPVFCGQLVERIAAAAGGGWDVSLIDTDLNVEE